MANSVGEKKRGLGTMAASEFHKTSFATGDGNRILNEICSKLLGRGRRFCWREARPGMVAEEAESGLPKFQITRLVPGLRRF